MNVYDDMSIWMVSGSQHLYGEETLNQVKAHTEEIADYLSTQDGIASKIEYKGILTTPEGITDFCIKASSDASCGGVILWMHTFSPSKMWINGFNILNKPVLHLHTQYNRDIPWDEIDMDFMNLNQSAHGGREHGFINARMKLSRKVVVGFWQDEEVHQRIDAWVRACAAVKDMRGGKIARFGDNMRDVAVTEGDKVAAQIALGYDVYGYAVGDLAAVIAAVDEKTIDVLIEEYKVRYDVSPELLPGASRADDLRTAARLEAGMTSFLEEGGFCAFTTTFEDLHGLAQLPGLACQRLMEKGYGFGAEGDWKTSALVRAMKVMGKGKGGGTSFMEDYTYHLDPENPLVLGSHMLEVCPSIGGETKVKLEIHPLGIGGKEDPVRMVFNVGGGDSLNASLMDMGNRFRLLINEVETVDSVKDLPKLPVARVVWKPKPDLKTAAAAWILGGGAHHTGYSKDVTTEMLLDYAEICGLEAVVIDDNTEIRGFKNELKWNDLYYTIKGFAGGV
ncbi:MULTISPECIES: L-arabinose isomerase [unclassified Oceanispirochaeta]|uniref:L-arabinose isomerase n=1 Tax=unclassified Oceanispirochaeta TaxID=2635722 RepID=UPI000E093789|nr:MULTISPECIES: L-arabinose isomerase [unclassified Oceanispirochaeta]MBF9018222.1 L-arabinose isomerase [Oceanispirochaeta sp. M2]NPD74672.1 L-arabinose isomerase [Oceanispirochaeta sp. M1]RDG29492.1 L-arabinose isomerase [Oceanispirochaeta sp. M1]